MRLFFLLKHIVTHDKDIYSASGEGGVGVIGGGNDRFASEIEGSIQKKRNASFFVKSLNERVVEGIFTCENKLGPGSMVGVGYGRYFLSPGRPHRHDVEHEAEGVVKIHRPRSQSRCFVTSEV